MATDTTESDTLVSRQEAARLAGVHVNTIRLWEDGERLHSVKQENGRVLIRLSELEAVVRERGATAGDPERRIIELEAEREALRAELELHREMLSFLKEQHHELLAAIKDLTARGRE